MTYTPIGDDWIPGPIPPDATGRYELVRTWDVDMSAGDVRPDPGRTWHRAVMAELPTEVNTLIRVTWKPDSDFRNVDPVLRLLPGTDHRDELWGWSDGDDLGSARRVRDEISGFEVVSTPSGTSRDDAAVAAAVIDFLAARMDDYETDWSEDLRDARTKWGVQ